MAIKKPPHISKVVSLWKKGASYSDE